jgi:hypothetical protein
MQMVAISQTFDSGNLLADNGTHLRQAGAVSDAVNQNRAGAALPFSTAILRAGKIQFIAEHPEKRPLRICFHVEA